MGAVTVTLSGVSRPRRTRARLCRGAAAVVYTQSMQVLDLAATQLSGTPGVDATGDFYDVFPLQTRAGGEGAAKDAVWWWVVVGGVWAKGMAAAAVAPAVRLAAPTVASGAFEA